VTSVRALSPVGPVAVRRPTATTSAETWRGGSTPVTPGSDRAVCAHAVIAASEVRPTTVTSGDVAAG
jgi:hypothetical protein